MVVIAPEHDAVPLGGRRWRAQAACRDLTPEQSRPFVAASPTGAERVWAMALCDACPVWRECRAWAAGEDRFQGIAGGRAWRLLGHPRRSDVIGGEGHGAAGVASRAPRARAAGASGAAA